MLTVGITTRNRPDAVARCLRSLDLLGDQLARVILVDDTSDVPASSVLQDIPSRVRDRLEIIRHSRSEGNIVGRNEIVRRSQTADVLLLDDDAFVIDPRAIADAVNVLARSPGVGAVAFAQADAEGRPWPVGMQPSTSAAPCVVAAFIGFAHLVRRDLFLSLGGYRESFHFYGEEKDFCLRLLHAGYRVAYLPDALVAHVPDMGNRSRAKHLRHLVRNDCLSSLYNEPWPLAILSLPIRLARHRSMCRAGRFKDPGGFRWIVSGLIATFPDVWRHRTPVSWESIKRWRALTRAPQPFEAARV